MHPPKGRILCAEDDHDARELIMFTLRLNGYQVACVETGTEALSLAKNEHFDLFLVDNWLPGLNGPELTRHIREFNRTTPVLFYSGAAYEDDKQAAFDAGAQGYLIKPISIERLVEEVDRLIKDNQSIRGTLTTQTHLVARIDSSPKTHSCERIWAKPGRVIDVC